MSVCRPGPAQNSLLTHSQKKNRPRKTGRPSNEKTNGPIQKSLLTRSQKRKQDRKNKTPLSPGPREPRAFNILCSGSPIPIPRHPPGCFFLCWVPSRAPARNHYSLTRRKKTGQEKQAGRVMKKQMPLLFFHYSLRTTNRKSSSCSLTGFRQR